MQAPYLTWLFLFVIIPTAVLWLFWYKMLWRYRMVFVYCVAISLAFGIAWDFFAIFADIWFWPEACCILPRVWGLPLEELGFIVFVCVATVTLTLVLRQLLQSYRNHRRDQ